MINIVRPTGVWFPKVFDEVCDLLMSSFEEIGLPSKVQFDSEDRNCLNLVLTLFYSDVFLRSLPRSSIIFQMENLVGEDEYSIRQRERARVYARHYPFWDYSLANLEVLKAFGSSSPLFFEFGYCKALERYNPLPIRERPIDVLFYGHLNDHRKSIISQISRQGAKVVHLQGSFGLDRDSFLLDSKIVLNLHNLDGTNFEICRVHYPLNNNFLVVSEINANTSIFPKYKKYIVGFPKETIASDICTLLSDQAKLDSLQRAAMSEFKKSSQSEILMALLPQRI